MLPPELGRLRNLKVLSIMDCEVEGAMIDCFRSGGVCNNLLLRDTDTCTSRTYVLAQRTNSSHVSLGVRPKKGHAIRFRVRNMLLRIRGREGRGQAIDWHMEV